MSKQAKLIKNTIILIMGKFSTQFISLLLLPLYTSMLTTSEYGVVDLITTYIVLLVPIITIQIEMGLFRFLIDCRDNEHEKIKIISNCFYLVCLISFLTIIIFIIINNIYDIKYALFLILMLLVTIASNILLQTCRGLGDNIGYSIACIITAVINILLNLILLLNLNMGIYSVFISTIISNLIGAFFLFIRNKIYKYLSLKSLDKKFQKEIIKYSLPLVPNGLVWWIINASDRTLITIMIDVSANGVYSVSNKFSNIINNFYSIFNMSWMESVSLYIDDNDDFLKKTFNTIFKTICSLCLCFINSMFILFHILIESKFDEAYRYIPILIMSSVFSMLAANLSAIYIAKKKTKEIANTTIVASILNVVINVILIKKIGLYAATVSTLVAFMILFILRYFDVQKYVDLKLNKMNILLFTFMFAVSYVIYSVNNVLLNIINLIVSLIILYIININEIKIILAKITNMFKKMFKKL